MSATTAIRLVAGLIFVVFGAGKFVDHGAELASFRGYGLPFPAFTVIAIGALELVGGLALLADRLTRPVAALLAANMAVAIAVAGIGHGEVVPSLTLAPALLVGMLVLLARAAPGAPGPPRARTGRRRSALAGRIRT